MGRSELKLVKVCGSEYKLIEVGWNCLKFKTEGIIFERIGWSGLKWVKVEKYRNFLFYGLKWFEVCWNVLN